MIGPCGGYRTVQDEGVDLTRRRTLDFAGAGVTATDDAANERTLVTIPGGGGGGAVAQIANSTLGGSAASFDISGISATYNHLWLLAILRGTNFSLNVEARVRVNNVTASAYYWERAYGTAATVAAAEGLGETSGFVGWAPGTVFSNSWSGFVLHFPGAGNTASGYRMWTAQWALNQGLTTTNTITGHAAGYCTHAAAFASAINQITVLPSVGSWAAGSQLSLYGVT